MAKIPSFTESAGLVHTYGCGIGKAKTFNYKGCVLIAVDRGDHYRIRLADNLGYRYFETADKHNLENDVLAAYEVQQEIIEHRLDYCNTWWFGYEFIPLKNKPL